MQPLQTNFGRELVSLPIFLFKVILFHAEEDAFHFFGAAGAHGEEIIPPAEYGIVGGDGKHEEDHSEHEAGDAE